MLSNGKHLTREAVIALFKPHLYPLDVSYRIVNEVRWIELFYVCNIVISLTQYLL